MQENNQFGTENHISSPKPGLIKNIPPLLYVFIVLAIIFFVYQFIGGTLAYVSGADEFNVTTGRIIISFSQFMFILAPTIFFARLQTADLRNTFRLKMPHPVIFVLAVIGMILIQPLLQGYMYFQDLLIDNLPLMKDTVNELKELYDMIESATIKLVRAYSVPEFLFVVFIIGITPAVCEEFLFRGFVLSNFRKLLKPTAAIFLSGFMFAVYHFQPFNTIPLIILGLYLGYVVYYSGSIYTGIFCHFLNNFLSAYLLFIYGKEEFETPHFSGSEKLNYVLITVASSILFIPLLISIYKLHLKTRSIE